MKAPLLARLKSAYIALAGDPGGQHPAIADWLTGGTGSAGSIELAKPYNHVVWVYVCIRKIATSIAQVPLKFYALDANPSPDADAQGNEVTTGRIIELFNRPNSQSNRYHFIEGLVSFLKISGETLVILNRQNAGGLPGSMTLVNPVEQNYELNEERNAIKYWRIIVGDKTMEVPPEFVIHLKQFNPDHPVRGMSDLSALRLTLEGNVGASKSNVDFFRNGTAPGTIISIKGEITPEQEKRLIAQWEERHTGGGKGHRPAFVQGDTTVTQGMSQRDLEFLSYINMTREEICAVFGVPPALVGIHRESANFTSEVQERLFWQNTCLPIMRAIEVAFNTDLFERYRQRLEARFDTSGIRALQDNITARVDAGVKVWGQGVPLREVNRRFGLGLQLDAVPSADVAFVPFNLTAFDPNPAPATEPPEDPAARAASPGPAGKAPASGDKATPANEATWKRYVAAWQPIETAYAKKLSNFFFDLRKETLRNLDEVLSRLGKSRKDEEKPGDLLAQIEFNVQKARTRIATISMPFVKQALTAGGGIVNGYVPSGAVEFNWHTDRRIAEFLGAKETRLQELVNTIDEHLRERMKTVLDRTIAEAAANGTPMSVSEAIVEASDEIGAAARQTFNVANGRALTIARTEVGQAVSMARTVGFTAIGVNRLEWVTAMDENVRESHQLNEGVVRRIGETYPNGLTMPNDPNGEAAEVINCRCTTVPAAPTGEED